MKSLSAMSREEATRPCRRRRARWRRRYTPFGLTRNSWPLACRLPSMLLATAAGNAVEHHRTGAGLHELHRIDTADRKGVPVDHGLGAVDVDRHVAAADHRRVDRALPPGSPPLGSTGSLARAWHVAPIAQASATAQASLLATGRRGASIWFVGEGAGRAATMTFVLRKAWDFALPHGRRDRYLSASTAANAGTNDLFYNRAPAAKHDRHRSARRSEQPGGGKPDPGAMAVGGVVAADGACQIEFQAQMLVADAGGDAGAGKAVAVSRQHRLAQAHRTQAVVNSADVALGSRRSGSAAAVP